MRPTSPTPTGNALSGLKEEAAAPACRPPLAFLAKVHASDPLKGGKHCRTTRELLRPRPAVHTSSGSFFLRRLEVRP